MTTREQATANATATAKAKAVVLPYAGSFAVAGNCLI
jgi:hypothetical protein